jgi:hypothetical protein
VSSRGLRKGGVEPTHGKCLVSGNGCGRERRARNEFEERQGYGLESVEAVAALDRLLGASEFLQRWEKAVHDTSREGAVLATTLAAEQQATCLGDGALDDTHTVTGSHATSAFAQTARSRVVVPGPPQNKNRWPVSLERFTQTVTE